MKTKKANMLSAVRFWALGEGMEEIKNEMSSDGFAAKKNGFKVNFITEFDKSKDELLDSITKIKSDFIYVVTNDNAKRRELIKIIPDYCGILCYGNPFGFGFLYQVLKKPSLIL